MTKSQWADVCGRISDIWPGSKRLLDGTVNAWYDQVGTWMEYEVALKVVSRLADTEHKRPTLAFFRETYSGMAGPRARVGEQVESAEARAADRERWARNAADWRLINYCMHDAGVKAVFHALDDDETDPAEMTEALLAEIRERNVQPIEPKGMPRGGDLTAIGDVARSVLK